MLNFISFGSGSSGNCYYLFTENEGLMIDVGLGIRNIKKYFREYGLSFQTLHNIIITHDHADHVKSVGALSYEYNLPVYATESVHYGISKNYCVRHKVQSQFKKIISKNTPFILGEFNIMPFDVPHDSMDNVGFKIEYQGIVFCIMTDIGHVTPEIKKMVGEADYLVIEANYDAEMLLKGPYPQYLKDRIVGGNGHLCNKYCADVIAESASSRLKYIWLCHLSEENNHPELARITVEQTLIAAGMDIGNTVQLDVLKRNMPMGAYLLK